MQKSTEDGGPRRERLSRWVGRRSAAKIAEEALSSMAKEDLALMMSIWPELSERERELQAPMLLERPEDLVEWMTAGASWLGLGEDTRLRRQRERDLSWLGFRLNGENIYKHSDKHSAVVANPSLVAGAGWRAAMWALALGRAINPLAACVAPRKSSNDMRPFGLYVIGAMLSWSAGGMLISQEAIEVMKDSGASVGALFLAAAIKGLPIFLAWRVCWSFGSKADRAATLKAAAIPRFVGIPRALRAWGEERAELRSARHGCGRKGAFFNQWLSSRKRESSEGLRKESFERGCDFDQALAAFEAFEMGRASPVDRAPNARNRGVRL